MEKIIGQLLLASWIPLVLGMAFADSYGDSPWYTVSGFMLIFFGTWAGVLLVSRKE